MTTKAIDQPIRKILAPSLAAYDDVIASSGRRLLKRVQQRELLEDMATAFDDEEFAILESQPGTGKSIDQCIVAAAFAVLNKKKVLIVTPQKALQQQMMAEFDNLATRSGNPILARTRVALLKGRRNYASIFSLDALVDKYEDDPNRYAQMIQFRDFVHQCGGDLDLIRGSSNIPSFLEPDDIDQLALPQTADLQNDYYLTEAQESAADAHVVITNHFLVLALMRQKISSDSKEAALPLDYLIIDEGDTFIQSAFSFFTNSIALRTVKAQLRNLYQQMDREKFHGAKTFSQQIDKALTALSAIAATMTSIGQMLKRNGKRELYIRNINSYAPEDKPTMQRIRKQVKDLNDILKSLKAEKYRKHFKKSATKQIALELDDSASLITTFLHGFEADNNNRNAYVISFSSEMAYPSFSKLSPSIAGLLYKHLWADARTVIFTSGTLSDFSSTYAQGVGTRQEITCNHFITETGLYPLRNKIRTYAYKRPFAFQKVTMHLYKGAPRFQSIDNDDDASREIRENLLAFALEVVRKTLPSGSPKSAGGAMILVPSHQDVDILTATFNLALQVPRRTVISQGPQRKLQACISEFRTLPEPSQGLLVLTAGWRGLDLPKKELTDLYIPRIPRTNPRDPQTIARQYANQQRLRTYAAYRITQGLDEPKTSDTKGFTGFLTEDVWKYKQGIGRLCRTEADEGHIHLMDVRLLTDPKLKPLLDWLHHTFPNIITHR